MQVVLTCWCWTNVVIMSCQVGGTMPKYDCVDLFAGQRALSRGFTKRGCKSTALDINININEAALLHLTSLQIAFSKCA